MSSINQTALPNDVSYELLSYLNVKELGIAGQVCKHWKVLASNNNLWEVLFLRTFSIPAPKDMPAKEAVFKYGAPIIQNGEELFKKYVSFRCHLELNKKREFICFSEELTPTTLFAVEQGFGPYHGTEKGFIGSADETEICKITRNINRISLVFNPSKIIPNNKIIESNLNGINICTQATTTSYLTSTQFQNAFCINYVDVCLRDDVFDQVVIEGVNVGWGNTLGYCSNINNWKKPFKLSCVNGKWSGRIPSHMCLNRELISGMFLKFVKIDPKGIVTWETCEENRCCDISNYLWGKRINPRDYLDHPDVVNQCWNQYLKDFPIIFPN